MSFITHYTLVYAFIYNVGTDVLYSHLAHQDNVRRILDSIFIYEIFDRTCEAKYDPFSRNDIKNPLGTIGENVVGEKRQHLSDANIELESEAPLEGGP